MIDKCLRCLSGVMKPVPDTFLFKCVHCEIMYNTFTNTLLIVINKRSIFWFMDVETTEVFGENRLDEPIRFEYLLPFDITIERIEKLLLLK